MVDFILHPDAQEHDSLYIIVFFVLSDVFLNFKSKSGKFEESLRGDTLGLLSLYEASNVMAQGEEILEEAMEFAVSCLERSLAELAPRLRDEVARALEVPRHLRMGRLEARRFIEEYGKQSEHDGDLFELAILDYNQVQAQHQMELTEITRYSAHAPIMEFFAFFIFFGRNYKSFSRGARQDSIAGDELY